MNKSVFFMAAAFVCLLSSCEKEISAETKATSAKTKVKMTFTGIDIIQTPFEAPTRAALSTAATRLDVWVSDGTTTTSSHQTSNNSNFGTVSMTLDNTKTYTLYAVGHKADGQATLADGIISFPDDKVKDTFWYTTTFSPSTTTAINAEMQRIVAQFKLETTDAVPATVKKMRITLGNVYDRWNVTTGATHNIDRVSTITISSTNSDGTASFISYAILSDTQTLHTVTAEALDANNTVINQYTHVFTDVPLRNNYKTVCRGAFFTNETVGSSFSVESDWNDYDVMNF